ncbi:MAG: hypothetical protein HY706_11590 [Candidatus Hydrogenedentes bacterium]|nr:hypothetical protein [Candidatus Hydrogenedentota bacterium]
MPNSSSDTNPVTRPESLDETLFRIREAEAAMLKRVRAFLETVRKNRNWELPDFHFSEGGKIQHFLRVLWREDPASFLRLYDDVAKSADKIPSRKRGRPSKAEEARVQKAELSWLECRQAILMLDPHVALVKRKLAEARKHGKSTCATALKRHLACAMRLSDLQAERVNVPATERDQLLRRAETEEERNAIFERDAEELAARYDHFGSVGDTEKEIDLDSQRRYWKWQAEWVEQSEAVQLICDIGAMESRDAHQLIRRKCTQLKREPRGRVKGHTWIPRAVLDSILPELRKTGRTVGDSVKAVRKESAQSHQTTTRPTQMKF